MAGQVPFATIGGQDDKIVLPDSLYAGETGLDAAAATERGTAERAAAERAAAELGRRKVSEDEPIALPVIAPEPADSALPHARRQWVPAAIGLGALASWSGLFGWAHANALAQGITPADAVGLAAQWSGPALVIVLGWGLLARSSSKAHGHYLSAAQALRAESLALDERLAAMNREISLAREFLNAQGRDLDRLGRLAVDRLSTHAARLAEVVSENANQMEALSGVSGAALDNMSALRDQVPVLMTASRDIANMIGNSSLQAKQQLADIAAGLERIGQSGAANQQQIAGLKAQHEALVAALDSQLRQFDSAATARLQGLEARSAAFDAALERHQADTLAHLRARIDALHSEIDATRATLDTEEGESLISLRARFSALRDEAGALARHLREGEAQALAQGQEAAARVRAQLAEIEAGVAKAQADQISQAATLGQLAEATGQRLAGLHAQITDLASTESGAAHELAARLAQLEAQWPQTRVAIDRLNADAAHLLETLASSTHNAQTQLPAALAQGQQQLNAYGEQIDELRSAIGAAGHQAQALAALVANGQAAIEAAQASARLLHDQLGTRLGENGAALHALEARTQGLDQALTQLAGKAQGELAQAVDTLAKALARHVQQIDQTAASRMQALAATIGTHGAAAIEHALGDATARIGSELERGAAQASAVAGAALDALGQRMAEVEQQVGHLEQRLAAAQAVAAERLDNDFARRAAVITDTLNSAAIDITTALASEVADTAWAAYLRGDRGIFTRRSVRLLDSGDAKAVLALYDSDKGFAEAVNRFIHDFEALLRQLLATRDGHALSVTLLSSDIGKLYVALAQAIERLRG